MLRELAGTLDAAVSALRFGDEEAADQVLERARATEGQLQRLADANSEGLAVVRHSPFRRRQRPEVEAYADLLVPLDRASRNLRVLARRAVTVVWRQQRVPVGYLEVIIRLARTARFMAEELGAGRLPSAARGDLVATGEASSHLELAHSLSAVAILAQTRSMVVDLLELTGLGPDDARDLVPDLD